MNAKYFLLSFLLILLNLFVFAQDFEILTGPFFDSTNYVSPPPLKTDYKGIIPITHYQQCNQSWSGNSYGIGDCSTICANGCAMTSGAMLLKVNGVNVNPGQLNSWLQNNSGYSGCSVLWTSVDNYPGSTMTWYGSAAYSLSILKSEIDAGNPVIVHVNSSSPCHHFIVIYGYNGSGTSAGDFLVADPGSSTFPKYWSNYVVCSETYALRLFHHVSCAIPATPLCVSPGTGSSPGQTITTLTPTLTWSAVPGATDYDVFIRKDPLVPGPLVLQQYCVAGNTLLVPTGTLINGGLYRWNVQANVNCDQCESGYAVPLYFQVQLSTGVNENIFNSGLNIYPNPACDNITMDLRNIQKTTGLYLSIYNIQGQILLQQTLQQYNTEIDISQLQQGVYITMIKLNDGSFIQDKFVVVK